MASILYQKEGGRAMCFNLYREWNRNSNEEKNPDSKSPLRQRCLKGLGAATAASVRLRAGRCYYMGFQVAAEAVLETAPNIIRTNRVGFRIDELDGHVVTAL